MSFLAPPPRSLSAALLGVSVFGATLAACGRTPVPPSPPPSFEITAEAHRAEVEDWIKRREDRLRQPESWLSLVGLGWLEEGDNRAGSASGVAVPLPADRAPADVGTFTRQGPAVSFEPARGVTGVTLDGQPVTGRVALAADSAEKPSVLALGSLRLFLIERGDRFAIRVKDRESPLFSSFHGMERFPIDPTWRIVARWEPYDPPKRIGVPTILGTIEESPSPGVAVFERDGVTYRLEPILEEGVADELFFIFGDQTNGKETYGAGRFFYSPMPVDGRIVLDFNKAYNPPCVFTPWATCPVPPPQNKLALRVLAGERDFHGYAH
jgi:uncharacterized protein (DUF1684 family)